MFTKIAACVHPELGGLMTEAFAREFIDDDDSLDAAKVTRQALIDTQERMGMMFDIMPMGLLIHTRQGILFANQEACRMLGGLRDQLVGQHILDFVAQSEVSRVMEQIDRSFESGIESINQETLLHNPRGRVISIKLISVRLPWAGTPVIQLLLQDVTDLKLKEQQLQRLSIIDELTGIHNRRHVFSEAARHLEVADRSSFDLSVALLDVDHFKKINDGHGHGVGDQALISLAGTASEIVRAEGGDDAVLGRIGGEEFLLLLPNFTIGQSAALGERLRHAASAIDVRAETGTLNFTVSLGVASLADHDRSFDTLVARADAALYEAKNRGRNQVVVAA
jgi:diguanylate cyclase (GGDEF)-like protein/PAS domain S-box-containing protein